MRRLRNDLLALEQLVSESSVFRFSAHGNPPTHYEIVFRGTGLYRDTAKTNKVKTHEAHRVQIKLGSSYPRTMPEIRWQTPVYHPNISEIGMVCLGGYATHWVPSLQLDELCVMLWDMVRYHNYDVRSPYNRDAALWVASQTTILFPTDNRPLRDLRAALGRIEPAPAGADNAIPKSAPSPSSRARALAAGASRVREFIGKRYNRAFGEVVPAPQEPQPSTERGVEPRSSGLQDLISAELFPAEHPPRPSPALTPPASSPHATADDLVILEEPIHEPPPARTFSALRPAARDADEIRFIE